jgi:hypothetical protein
MIHHGQRLPLGLEAGDDLLGVHAELDDLEGDAATNGFDLLRDIHHATTAFADPLQQLVAPNGLADGLVRSLGNSNLQRGWRAAGQVGQCRVRLFVSGEEGVQPLAQGGVAQASAVEKRRALRGGLFQSQREKGSFPFLRRRHRRVRFVQIPLHAQSPDEKYGANAMS